VAWVHGLTGRFYEPHTVTIGRALATAGYPFVAGNNRGHDFGTTVRPRGAEPFLAGGAWERFDESPRDVAGWVGFAAGQAARGVVLVGHSLGALKVAYYLAQRQDPRVVGLVAASPPTGAGQLDPEALAWAERQVATGRGEDLVPQPVRGRTFSAQTYLNRARANVDVYGFHRPEPPVARIRCPLLALYGDAEPQVGTAADLETIRRNASAAPRVDLRVFPGADHLYTGHEAEVAAALVAWIATLASAR
jgi:pimeloyl-ACP methyl ester carboxylesterase